MSWAKRFVWWKVVFWFALGAGLGAAIVVAIGEPGPGLSTRIGVEDFVNALHYPTLADGNRVANIVIYPNHQGVEMVKFDFTAGGKTQWAYIYAKTPFADATQLQDLQARKDTATARLKLRESSLAYFATMASLRQRREEMTFESFDTVEHFLAKIQPKQPAAAFTTAWWTDKSVQYDIAVPAGAIVIGVLFSLLLARRSAADILAAEMLKSASTSTTAAVPTGPSAADLAKLAELDDLMAKKLAGGGDADDSEIAGAEPAAVGNAVKTLSPLSNEPLAAIDEGPKEDKDYKGEFYPTVVRNKPRAFSLVELLVVIGVIGILIGILLPTLMRARKSADTLACAANLYSIGVGMQMYLQENNNTYPPAYLYIGHSIVNGVQTPTSSGAGYIHWSSYLYGKGVAASAFTCPAMDRGGMPPTNTTPDNMNAGQVCPNPAITDEQAPRLAYTVNEALCPRNKFVTGFQGAKRIYRFVKATEVQNSTGTIFATEMIDNQLVLSRDENSVGFIISHRPITGFVGVDGTMEMYLVPPGTGFRKVTAADLDPDPMSSTSSASELDLVGRNHGVRRGYPDKRLTNFCYADWHVETKSIYDTVSPFEWGEKFYSLVPNDDLQAGP